MMALNVDDSFEIVLNIHRCGYVYLMFTRSPKELSEVP
jgi:hypothetical protein